MRQVFEVPEPQILVTEDCVYKLHCSCGELSRRTGATYLVAGANDVDFERRGVSDEDELEAGRLHITVVAMPVHADSQPAYVVSNGNDGPVVFTGSSLLYGSVGRTDLVERARTDELTRADYQSARHLANLLADDVAVYPTHGVGRFCSSGPSSSDTESTIGAERGRNDSLVSDGEEDFVATLVAGLTVPQSCSAHMYARKRGGADPIDLSPPARTDPTELTRRVGDGEWVVDLRSTTVFAADHPACTIEIGLKRPHGAAVGAPRDRAATDDQLRSYPTATFADVSHQSDVVLDVRRDDERAKGHLPGSIHIPLHALAKRIADVPGDGCGCTAPRGIALRSRPACSTGPDATLCWSTTKSSTPSMSWSTSIGDSDSLAGR